MFLDSKRSEKKGEDKCIISSTTQQGKKIAAG
jgi:hypothetical protein